MLEIIPNWHPIFVHFTVTFITVIAILQLDCNFTAGDLVKTQERKHGLHVMVAKNTDDHHLRIGVGDFIHRLGRLQQCGPRCSVTHGNDRSQKLGLHHSYCVFVSRHLVFCEKRLATIRSGYAVNCQRRSGGL